MLLFVALVPGDDTRPVNIDFYARRVEMSARDVMPPRGGEAARGMQSLLSLCMADHRSMPDSVLDQTRGEPGQFRWAIAIDVTRPVKQALRMPLMPFVRVLSRINCPERTSIFPCTMQIQS